jgi:DNA-binding transcriptional regulator YhcF (GntR family)
MDRRSASGRQGALARARAHLEAVVADAAEAGRTRLPTIAQLAEAAGVARATMHKAARLCVEEGTINANRGTGIVRVAGAAARGDEGNDAHVSAQVPSWHSGSLRQRISRDTLSGVHPFGQPLPQIKQLCADYGAGYRTMKKALEGLSETGLLTPFRRGYRVHDPEHGHFRNTIVLVCRGTPSGAPSIPTERTREYFAVLDRECVRRNLRLHVVTVQSRAPGEFHPSEDLGALLGGRRAENVLGVMLFTMTVPEAFVRELMLLLTRFRTPVAALDETGMWELPGRTRQPKHMRPPQSRLRERR